MRDGPRRLDGGELIDRLGQQLIALTAEIRGTRLGVLSGLSAIATAVIIGAALITPGGLPWGALAGLL